MMSLGSIFWLVFLGALCLPTAVAGTGAVAPGTCDPASEVVPTEGVYAFAGQCANGVPVIVFFYSVSEILWVDVSPIRVRLALGGDHSMPYFEWFPDGFQTCTIDTYPCQRSVDTHLRGGLVSMALLVLDGQTSSRLTGRIATAIEIKEWDTTGPFVFSSRGTHALGQLIGSLVRDLPVDGQGNLPSTAGTGYDGLERPAVPADTEKQ